METGGRALAKESNENREKKEWVVLGTMALKVLLAPTGENFRFFVPVTSEELRSVLIQRVVSQIVDSQISLESWVGDQNIAVKTMDSEVLRENAPYIVGGAVGVISIAVILKKILKRPKVYNDPPDTVILCSIPRGPAAPSMSMYPLKLETYLRVSKIPHKVVTDRGMSPKGKTPYIMLNGEAISDSQLSMEFLNKKFNVDLDKHLNLEQRATARAFRKMMEEGFYWCFVLERWIYGDRDYLCKAFGDIFPVFLVRLMIPFIGRKLKKWAYGQGMGRHSPEEVREIGVGDLKAYSDFLGKKPYFMGDKVSEVDCCIFGFLCQCKYHIPGTVYEKAVTKDFPNLNEFVERMKNLYWPDWDECITHNGTRKALK